MSVLEEAPELRELLGQLEKDYNKYIGRAGLLRVARRALGMSGSFAASIAGFGTLGRCPVAAAPAPAGLVPPRIGD